MKKNNNYYKLKIQSKDSNKPLTITIPQPFRLSTGSLSKLSSNKENVPDVL